MLIAVLVWWCGNEISGQWGCTVSLRGFAQGIQQLLRATKADNNGHIRLLVIDVPMKERIGQLHVSSRLSPVRRL